MNLLYRWSIRFTDSVIVYLDHVVILHMSTLHFIHEHVSLRENIWKKILHFHADRPALWGSQTDQPLWFLCLSVSTESEFPQVRPANISTFSSHFNPQTWRTKLLSFLTRSSVLTFLSLFMLSSEKALSTVSFSFCGGWISISITCKDVCWKTTSPCLQVSWCEPLGIRFHCSEDTYEILHVNSRQ